MSACACVCVFIRLHRSYIYFSGAVIFLLPSSSSSYPLGGLCVCVCARVCVWREGCGIYEFCADVCGGENRPESTKPRTHA